MAEGDIEVIDESEVEETEDMGCGNDPAGEGTQGCPDESPEVTVEVLNEKDESISEIKLEKKVKLKITTKNFEEGTLYIKLPWEPGMSKYGDTILEDGKILKWSNVPSSGEKEIEISFEVPVETA